MTRAHLHLHPRHTAGDSIRGVDIDTFSQCYLGPISLLFQFEQLVVSFAIVEEEHNADYFSSRGIIEYIPKP